MILVTGANGLIGRALCKELTARGRLCRGVVRKIDSFSLPNTLPLGDINGSTDWSSALHGVDCIIHSASTPSYKYEIEKDENRNADLEAISCLSEQAVAMGIKRLVYISSIKVNGQNTKGLFRDNSSVYKEGAKFTHLDVPDPMDPYGVSKWKSEQILWEVSSKTGLEVVVIRPPLVYGPSVQGNLGRLLKLVRTGVPLPLGAVQNQRSFIGLDNLVDILILSAYSPKAVGQTLLVSDGEDLSTPDLLRHMAGALGQSALLIPVPVALLHLAGRVLGKNNEIKRLLESLQIDTQYTCQLLDWKPPLSVAEGMKKMVQG